MQQQTAPVVPHRLPHGISRGKGARARGSRTAHRPEFEAPKVAKLAYFVCSQLGAVLSISIQRVSSRY